MSAAIDHTPTSRDGGVLVVGQGAPALGGIPRFLDDLLRSDLKDMHNVHHLNLMRGEIFNPGRFTGANVVRTLADAYSIWMHSRSARVVHINSALVPLVTLLRVGLLSLAARLRRARVITHVHDGYVELWLVTTARRLLARVLLSPAHVIVAASDRSRAALAEALGAERVVLIDNGVDLSTFAGGGGSHNPPRILFAGFLTARKGILNLLEASASLMGDGVEHELVVAGAPIPEAAGLTLEQLRESAGPHVRFVGYRPPESMPEQYLSVDVFCLPSWWEAMPLSVLEAMAAGLPVAASRVGDIPRAVADGITGVLVPPDRPDMLAAALGRLLRDPDLRTRMGAAGRRRVAERFNLATTFEALDGLYRQPSA